MQVLQYLYARTMLSHWLPLRANFCASNFALSGLKLMCHCCGKTTAVCCYSSRWCTKTCRAHDMPSISSWPPEASARGQPAASRREWRGRHCCGSNQLDVESSTCACKNRFFSMGSFLLALHPMNPCCQVQQHEATCTEDEHKQAPLRQQPAERADAGPQRRQAKPVSNNALLLLYCCCGGSPGRG